MKFIIRPLISTVFCASSCRTDCLFDTHCTDCDDKCDKSIW